MNIENEKRKEYYKGVSSNLNTAVLLIFFNRPKQLNEVFNQVKLVRPNRMFFYQDGPRKNKDDYEKIIACRKILEEIDWECEVDIWFREENCGCDPSEYLAQKWAFSEVDKCIVLEDDDVPSESFFWFCQELLEKYEHDERVNIISGMNTLGRYRDHESDYFFSTVCSIWGWASWRRVVEKWNAEYEYLDDKEVVNDLLVTKKMSNVSEVVSASRAHKKTGKAYYETILASQMFLNHQMNIVPSQNLITNIGISDSSTHASDSIEKLPHGIRRVFNMERYEVVFPLNHPKYMIEDIIYQKKVKRILGWGHPFIQKWRAIDGKISKYVFALKHRK